MTALLKSIGSYISFGIGVIGITWGAFVYIDNNQDTNSSQNVNIEKMLLNQDSIFKILKKQSDTQIVLFDGQRGIMSKVDRIEQGQKVQSKVLIKHIETTSKLNIKMIETIKELVPWSLNYEKKKQSNNQLTMIQLK
jgi:hypothetical protein